MLKIWTDGSCLGNPGAGGWAFIATNGPATAERSGGEARTTNNRMELTAVLRAVLAAKRHNEIEIHTDSIYVKDGMEKWLAGWKKNSWKTAAKQPVKNQDIWQALDAAVTGKNIHWIWVRGHDGEEFNERCDKLARAAAESFR